MPNTCSGGDVLSFTNSYLPTRLYACQKRIRIRRVRWCEGYVIRLLKVSSMSWLVVLLLHKSSMLPDIMQPWLQDTFLRGSARVRPCRLSATLVLNTKTLSQCTRGTIGNHFGMSLYLGSIKKLEPTEYILALSTTSQSELSRRRWGSHELQTGRKRRRRKPRGNTHRTVGNWRSSKDMKWSNIIMIIMDVLHAEGCTFGNTKHRSDV